MALRCGIVGLPNAGKSTLFNALTRGHAAVAEYPFTTIEPNVGIAVVPDPRLARLAALIPHDRLVPTTLEVTDVAGLVKGASQGEGLGNQFLAKIAEVEALLHVVRGFADERVPHAVGSVDPVRDAELINTELLLKDLDTVERAAEKQRKLAKGGNAKAQACVATMEQLIAGFKQGVPARRQSAMAGWRELGTGFEPLTAKPVLYVANIGEGDIGVETAPVQALRALVDREAAQLVTIAGKTEAELVGMPLEEQESMRQMLGLTEPALDRLVQSAYRLLGLISFFTAESRILQAWTVARETKAPQAAGRIHTDFEKGFIKAEVIGYDTFIKAGSEAEARARGWLRTEGKEYVVQDGDLIRFKFSV